MAERSQQVKALLTTWRQDDQAAGELIATLYRELRHLVSAHLGGAGSDGAFQPTAVVNELFLRLIEAEPVHWQSRAHFFGIAAGQLRRILVEHARHQAEKQAGRRVSVTLGDGSVEPRQQDLLELNETLDRLEEVDARAARVIELRFFAGLTDEEAAEVLGIPVDTLKRHWAFGRAWVLRHLPG